MSTLRQLTGGSLAIPAATAWYLADLGEFLDRALHQPGTPGRAEAGCYETLEQSSQGWHESKNDP